MPHPSLPYRPRPVVPTPRGPSASIVGYLKITPHSTRTLGRQLFPISTLASHAPSRRFFLPESELPIRTNTSCLPSLTSVIFCRQCVLDLLSSHKRASYPVILLALPSLLIPSLRSSLRARSDFGRTGSASRRNEALLLRPSFLMLPKITFLHKPFAAP
jgi:hypothetical protein